MADKLFFTNVSNAPVKREQRSGTSREQRRRSSSSGNENNQCRFRLHLTVLTLCLGRSEHQPTLSLAQHTYKFQMFKRDFHWYVSFDSLGNIYDAGMKSSVPVLQYEIFFFQKLADEAAKHQDPYLEPCCPQLSTLLRPKLWHWDEFYKMLTFMAAASGFFHIFPPLLSTRDASTLQ